LGITNHKEQAKDSYEQATRGDSSEKHNNLLKAIYHLSQANLNATLLIVARLYSKPPE